METLLEVLQGIEQCFGIRICVHDVSGITSASHVLNLPYAWMSHECAFCRQVKQLCGERRCIQQKETTMRMLRRNGLRPIAGLCSMGMCEYILPVTREGALLAVIYASSITAEGQEAARKRLAAQEVLHGNAALNSCFEAQASRCVHNDQLRFFAEMVQSVLLRDASLPLAASPADNRFPVEAIRIARKGIIPSVLQHLEAHAAGVVSVAGLAKTFYISEAHLCRLFRSEMGMTISAYLKELRIHAAQRELVETDESIAAISERVGYVDPNYFCRVFSQVTGMTPSQYRHLQRP